VILREVAVEHTSTTSRRLTSPLSSPPPFSRCDLSGACCRCLQPPSIGSSCPQSLFPSSSELASRPQSELAPAFKASCRLQSFTLTSRAFNLIQISDLPASIPTRPPDLHLHLDVYTPCRPLRLLHTCHTPPYKHNQAGRKEKLRYGGEGQELELEIDGG